MTLKRATIFSFVFSLPLLYDMLGGMLPGEGYTMWAISTPIIFWAGLHFHSSAWAALKNRNANMDTLISLGTLTAYFYSIYALLKHMPVYFEIGSFLIFFILLGQLLEELSKGRASKAIEALASLQPNEVTLVKGAKEKVIKVDDVKVGDVLKVKPGERIAVDGTVVNGESKVDESMVSGESKPVSKSKGSAVIGASINTNGTLTYKATKVGADTLLAQIIQMVRTAQTTKAPIQRVADNVSSYFVPAVIILAIITFNVWFVFIGATFTVSLLYAIGVIIIACPCALGIATPTALMVGTSQGAKAGILIKSGKVLESARNIKYVVFDKTGTLTIGKPVVTDVIGKNKKLIIGLAASVEQSSEHPLASAILNYAKTNKIKLQNATTFKALEGRGVQAKVGKNNVYVGKPTTKDFALKDDFAKLQRQGKTVVSVETNDEVIGIIAIADKPKDHAKTAIRQLEAMGLQTVMLTGDNQATASAVAKLVGIQNVIAEVMPADKLAEVKKLQSKGKVVFVGDGINDAPALAGADVGVAMGSGTDVAAESGDIVLVKSDVRDVPKALTLSKLTFRKIKQNLFWAFFYNTSAVPIAAGVFAGVGLTLNPALAGAAMAFSSLSVVLNSVLLSRIKL